MATTQPVTTRRIIRPGAAAIQSHAPPGPAPSTSRLWDAWHQRFVMADRSARAVDADHRERFARLPYRPDAVQAADVGARFVQPWAALAAGFDLASTGVSIEPEQRRALLLTVHMRLAYYEAVVLRLTRPSAETQSQVVDVRKRIDAHLRAAAAVGI